MRRPAAPPISAHRLPASAASAPPPPETSADPKKALTIAPDPLPVVKRCPGSLTTLMAPPSASDPYWVDVGPRTISTRSTNCGSMRAVYWLAPGRNVELLKRTPST